MLRSVSRAFVCIVIGTVVAGFNASHSFAWGERGHEVVCRAATHLVEDRAMVSLVKGRADLMSYLCNVPDTEWKRSNLNNDSSHYIQYDGIGKDLATASTLVDHFLALAKLTLSHLSQYDVNMKVGSLWWRVNQFYQLGFRELREIQSLGDRAGTDNRSRLISMMGLMGHFVGDASVPFHNTSDYDGFEHGQGGIHSYFETLSVNEIPFDLTQAVVEKAQSLAKTDRARIRSLSVPELVQGLSIQAYHRLGEVQVLDPIYEPSIDIKLPSGRMNHHRAKRANPEVGAKRFEKIIVEQLASSAILLANLWDRIYDEIQDPTISLDGDLKIPAAPAYIAPDYL